MRERKDVGTFGQCLVFNFKNSKLLKKVKFELQCTKSTVQEIGQEILIYAKQSQQNCFNTS